MDAKKALPIDVLEEIEAWNLFKETAENDFKDSELRSVATEVAKKCAGLPVAIVTVARALRSKELYAWKDALAQLQRPSPSDMQSGVPAAVYSAIELSYNNLKSEELKQTFLLCGLLGHNARAEDLVRYGMGLRLFENVDTVEDTRNRVLTLDYRSSLASALKTNWGALLPHLSMSWHSSVKRWSSLAWRT
ncbi:PREDICTED: disease resistance protein At4g27190-like isoform X1 [Theobroma cacao]|uniref:Disease resistance protein At4g27190-like isoform X1 n=1 Tax=Theobroma cacao TaxID=3641 RepID=A0AB32VY07_THECC|nr:PREDICTED: disease resistance protein At4g27190-like isoform X1 [Theobroma cacao]